MPKKVIAVDLNDVIRDYTSQFIVCYQKLINPRFEIEDKDVTSFNFSEVFPFNSKEDYNNFKYTDAAFELHARAELVDKRLPAIFSDWVNNVLTNLDVDEDPEVIIFSPLELDITIQSTLSFLAAHGARVREYVFPVNSVTIYDRADIVITANPNLINACPEGKSVIKISRPYNDEANGTYEFASLIEAIQDPEEKIIKLIEQV